MYAILNKYALKFMLICIMMLNLIFGGGTVTTGFLLHKGGNGVPPLSNLASPLLKCLCIYPPLSMRGK